MPLYQPLPPLVAPHSSQVLGLGPLDNHVVAYQERTEQFLRCMIRVERIQTLRESFRQPSRDSRSRRCASEVYCVALLSAASHHVRCQVNYVVVLFQFVRQCIPV